MDILPKKYQVRCYNFLEWSTTYARVVLSNRPLQDEFLRKMDWIIGTSCRLRTEFVGKYPVVVTCGFIGGGAGWNNKPLVDMGTLLEFTEFDKLSPITHYPYSEKCWILHVMSGIPINKLMGMDTPLIKKTWDKYAEKLGKVK